MKNAVLLSLMMFLQFMMLPVWYVPMLPYVQALPGSGDWVVWCGLIMGIGTFTSPLVGMFADRFLNAEKVLAICNFAGAGLLLAASCVTSPAALFAILLLEMCFYMPTWSLTASIGMAHATKKAFARVRVFGSLGWVASGAFSLVGTKCFGIEAFDSTRWIFVSGAAVSFAAGLLAFLLPRTEPSAKGLPMSVSDALGLKALVLFREPAFRSFALLLLFAMLPFQWYNAYCGLYLKETGFQYLTMTLNLGQTGEIGFMLLVPLVLAKFGFKRAMLIALGGLVFRNACFLGASAGGVVACDFGGILVHGLIFGILIVGSQMFIDEVAPRDLRTQAQGLVNLITAGVGVFASNSLFNAILSRGDASAGTHPWPLAYAVALGLSLVGLPAVALLFRAPSSARAG